MLKESNTEAGDFPGDSSSRHKSIRTGLDVLIRYREWDSLRAADRSTWERYRSQPVQELWRLMALRDILDPDSIDLSAEAAMEMMDSYPRENDGSRMPIAFDRYLVNLEAACAAVRQGSLQAVSVARDVRRCLVRVEDLKDWSDRSRLPVVDDWPSADMWMDWHALNASSNWSWGDATTYRLEMLRAGGVFWQAACKRGHIPLREEVMAHLLRLFPSASSRDRGAVASFLRPDDLKPGPRGVS